MQIDSKVNMDVAKIGKRFWDNMQKKSVLETYWIIKINYFFSVNII